MPIIGPKTPQSTTAQLEDPVNSTFQVVHLETCENMGIFPIGILGSQKKKFLFWSSETVLNRLKNEGQNWLFFPIRIFYRDFSYEICDFLLVCKKSILDRGIFTPLSTSQTLVNKMRRQLFLVVNKKSDIFSFFSFFDPLKTIAFS